MKRLLYIVAAVVVTIWQYQAGLDRCGTVDGGVLLVPLVVMITALVRGVSRDLRQALRPDLDQ